ncbi:MAG: hypothetical protein ACYDEX_08030 [Mobilitalea sp.]
MYNNGEKSKWEIMPPIITVIIILIILSTISVTREVLKSDKVSAARKSDNNTEQFIEANLNDNGKEIISILLGGTKISDVKLNQNQYTYYIFINCLKNQMTGSKMVLGSTQYEEMKNKASELINIMNMEGNKDFTKMSLDGRAVAIDIARQIYEISGLRMDITMKGEIEQILDQSGNEIYNRNDLQLSSNFQIYALLITLSTIFILLGIIFYVSKKNFNREEVAYHGFNKKRYA